MKEYALYHGEQFINIGTLNDLAKEQGVKPETLLFYSSPAYLKRVKARGFVLVKLDEL